MGKKKIFHIFALLTTLILTSCTISEVKDKDVFVEEVKNATPDNYTITVKDMARYLEKRQAHYPFSDEFIEKYQQSGGGYIENALKAGLVVDKLQHEPNQKWHFFDSWYYPSLEDGTLSVNDSAKSRIYTKLLCPELLLWIYEASGVDPIKVRSAMRIAEQGKTAGTNVSTIAKNMRSCVAWEDIEKNILKDLDITYDSYTVSVNNGEYFTISDLKQEYEEGSDVTFSINILDDTKEIDYVLMNGKNLYPIGKTTYKFTMPSENVSIQVELKKKEDKPINPTQGSYVYNIEYTLPGKTAKLLENSEDIYNTFNYIGNEQSILSSIVSHEYIYGGGRGGSGDTVWYAGDMLKFGTTSVNGYLTISLQCEVIGIIISGYTTNNAAQIRVGDSLSSDWTNDIADNKTSLVTCSEMSLSNKDNVETKNISSTTIYFASTNEVKIATTNKKPIYITSIEFIVAASANE